MSTDPGFQNLSKKCIIICQDVFLVTESETYPGMCNFHMKVDLSKVICYHMALFLLVEKTLFLA